MKYGGLPLGLSGLSRLVDLIKWGRGSGTDSTKYLRSNGIGGWTLASVAGFVPAAARVNRTTNQSIPTGVATALSFDAVRFDNSSLFNLANPTRLTASTAGRYIVGGGVDFLANATGYRQVMIRINSGTVLALVTQPGNQATSNPDAEFAVCTLADMAAGDYVELLVTQTSGGALNCQVLAGRSPEFYMVMQSGGPVGPQGIQGLPGATGIVATEIPFL